MVPCLNGLGHRNDHRTGLGRQRDLHHGGFLPQFQPDLAVLLAGFGTHRYPVREGDQHFARRRCGIGCLRLRFRYPKRRHLVRAGGKWVHVRSERALRCGERTVHLWFISLRAHDRENRGDRRPAFRRLHHRLTRRPRLSRCEQRHGDHLRPYGFDRLLGNVHQRVRFEHRGEPDHIVVRIQQPDHHHLLPDQDQFRDLPFDPEQHRNGERGGHRGPGAHLPREHLGECCKRNVFRLRELQCDRHGRLRDPDDQLISPIGQRVPGGYHHGHGPCERRGEHQCSLLVHDHRAGYGATADPGLQWQPLGERDPRSLHRDRHVARTNRHRQLCGRSACAVRRAGQWKRVPAGKHHHYLHRHRCQRQHSELLFHRNGGRQPGARGRVQARYRGARCRRYRLRASGEREQRIVGQLHHRGHKRCTRHVQRSGHLYLHVDGDRCRRPEQHLPCTHHGDPFHLCSGVLPQRRGNRRRHPAGASENNSTDARNPLQLRPGTGQPGRHCDREGRHGHQRIRWNQVPGMAHRCQRPDDPR